MKPVTLEQALHRKRPAPAPAGVLPFPEALTGTPWRVLPIGPDGVRMGSAMAGGGCDAARRFMFTPNGPERRDAAIRAHEMAHAKWTRRGRISKKRLARIHPALLNCAEDARINMRTARAGVVAIYGLPYSEPVPASEKETAEQRTHRRCVNAAFALAQGIVDGVHAVPGFQALTETDKDAVEQVYRKLTPRRCTTARAVKLAEQLTRYFAETEAASDDGEPDSLAPLKDRLGHYVGRTESGVRPGTMTIRTGALAIPCAKVWRARRWRNADTGIVPRAWHREHVDGAIFGRKVSVPGGTILVDVSGSMGISNGDLDALGAALPAATVAIYSGESDTGTLTIVAKNGRRVAHVATWRVGYGNIIDVPALDWLARQPGPRVWVSDGYATGCNDTSGPGILRACLATCRRASITRLDDVETLRTMLGARL